MKLTFTHLRPMAGKFHPRHLRHPVLLRTAATFFSDTSSRVSIWGINFEEAIPRDVSTPEPMI